VTPLRAVGPPPSRRRQVEAVLAAHGLATPRPALHRPASPAPASPDPDPLGFGRRLAAALDELGPLWAAWGRHLAHRADLLPAAQRAPLAALADRAPALPAEAAADLLRQRLDAAPDELFSNFEATPFASRLLEQRHRASSMEAAPRVVRLRRPRLAAAAVSGFGRSQAGRRQDGRTQAGELADAASVDAELELFALLQPPLAAALSASGQPPHLAAGAVEDGRRAVYRGLDLGRAGEILALLARTADGSLHLAAAVVDAERSAAGVLTVAEPPGVPAQEAAAALGDDGRSLMLRRLWTAWFTVAWEGLLPAPGDAGDLRWTADGRLAFLGEVRLLPASRRAALRDYLGALADGDGGAAAEALVRACHEVRPSPQEPAGFALLERRLRLASGFRDAPWTGVEGLPAEVLAHARVLASAGVEAPAPFDALFPAVAATAAQAARLGPEQGEAAQALSTVRLAAGLDGLRAAFDPRRLGPAALRQGLAAGGLPEKLDRALTRLADGDLTLRLEPEEGAAADRRAGAWLPAVACALVLAGLALVVPSLASQLTDWGWGRWGEVAAALLLLVVGGLMLAPPWRRRSRSRGERQ